MALQKTPIEINFAQGLDLKSDSKQVAMGRFLGLKNTVFNKKGLLQKRNGFGNLPSLTSQYQSLTTYKGNLLGLGTNISYLNADSNQWQTGGKITNVQNSVVPLVRNSDGQSAIDVAIASNGLSCAVYLDSDTHSYYRISDSITGEVIASKVALPTTATCARVFLLSNYFIITYLATVSATPHLQYIAIPISAPNSPHAAADVSAQVSSLTSGYDAYTVGNALYFAWYASDGGGALRIRSLNNSFALSPQVVIASTEATLVSVTADTTPVSPIIYVSWWGTSSTNGFIAAYDVNLNTVLAKTATITSEVLVTLTSVAHSGVCSLFYEINNTYSYTPNARTDYIRTNTVTQAGTVGTVSTILRSVGLAGKAVYFSPTATIYMLATYKGTYEPTYFLIDSTGAIISKLAPGNGGGYVANQVLASANVSGSDLSYGYQFRDLLLPVNKGITGAVGGVFTQSGVNLARFSVNNTITGTSEIAGDLHLTGGFPWMYDGTVPVEHGFHLYPEDITAVWSTTGGSIAAQPDGVTNTNAYAYQVTYEWTDAAGNIHRSAPSVPVFVTTTSNGTTGSITLNVPTLRLTYKLSPNPVRIVVYRWSVANPVFYIATTTFVSSPVANSTTTDSVTIVNTAADASIVGNPIIYTNGGVVEDISAPASTVLVPFKSRLFSIDAEDRNSLWYSKQVIENTPVEFSDLFTIFVAPTTGAQGSTGDCETLYPMDDKLIIGKNNALYYITGNGPDNTGANNDFSDPVYITSTVGCANQQSFVMIPDGLMFQSDKGIWLLRRNLTTGYIGADVEGLTQGATVKSALAIPETNQVRFTLDTGITLMYDYYYNQWSSFYGIPGISSTLYGGLHTFLNSAGQVLQETPNLYLDGTNPVLIGFTTSWIKLLGLQGYQRAYYFYMLATFLSAHKLNLQIAYDYNSNPTQSSTITPTNYGGTWGNDALWGDGEYWGGTGSEGDVEQHRVFLIQQKCQSFQIIAQEFYDPSVGTPPGAGLTISGLNLVIGGKKHYPTLRASNSVG